MERFTYIRHAVGAGHDHEEWLVFDDVTKRSITVYDRSGVGRAIARLKALAAEEEKDETRNT